MLARQLTSPDTRGRTHSGRLDPSLQSTGHLSPYAGVRNWPLYMDLLPFELFSNNKVNSLGLYMLMGAKDIQLESLCDKQSS